MLQVKLPDGSIKSYDESITALDVCKSIGPGLAKSMLAAEINGKLVDATTLINEDVDFKVITAKDNAGIDVIRHSTAHLLAQAVKSIYPAAQVTIGPVIEDGFYYDFYYPPGFKEADLEKIEKKMQELVAADLPVIRNEIEFDKAVEHFESIGEQYKAEIIKDIGDAQLLTTYTQGDFTDLCRGPHVPSTACLGVFKLTKLAGAYWRGDSNNPMLQRIYGTAWATKSQL
ncbi:MAG: TGS domain-containing protein, partial [Proteobacteria bacterium]|nr:TGS domain-containing protein [Pseudomonadota bacterium]